MDNQRAIELAGGGIAGARDLTETRDRLVADMIAAEESLRGLRGLSVVEQIAMAVEAGVELTPGTEQTLEGDLAEQLLLADLLRDSRYGLGDRVFEDREIAACNQVIETARHLVGNGPSAIIEPDNSRTDRTARVSWATDRPYPNPRVRVAIDVKGNRRYDFVSTNDDGNKSVLPFAQKSPDSWRLAESQPLLRLLTPDSSRPEGDLPVVLSGREEIDAHARVLLSEHDDPISSAILASKTGLGRDGYAAVVGEEAVDEIVSGLQLAAAHLTLQSPIAEISGTLEHNVTQTSVSVPAVNDIYNAYPPTVAALFEAIRQGLPPARPSFLGLVVQMVEDRQNRHGDQRLLGLTLDDVTAGGDELVKDMLAEQQGVRISFGLGKLSLRLAQSEEGDTGDEPPRLSFNQTALGITARQRHTGLS